MANFLYDVQNNSDGIHEPANSPRILKIADIFLRNLQIVQACKSELFTLDLNEFPEIRDNRKAYDLLLSELKDKNCSYLDDFNEISKNIIYM